jgi:hypothetical protein
MIKRKGLAQIPLMIGLLFMAVVVPVATKLVQESQDTRNRAASVITTTPPPSGCTEGYVRCFNNVQQRCQNGSWVFQKNCPNGCSGNYCKVVTPTNIPKPPTSTPRPPTSTPRPPTSTPKPCNATCASDCSRSPGYTGTCVNNVCKCTLKPTATPTPKPTGLPDGTFCTLNTGIWSDTYCKDCKNGWHHIGDFNSNNYMCGPAPTATPTPKPTGLPDGTSCTLNTGIWSDAYCKDCKNGWHHIGDFNSNNYMCGPAPTSTPKPCINATCASDCSRSPGYTGTCVNNVCKCTLKPTATPTKVPSATPTKVPSATPTGPLKCYCAVNCADDDCNWQSASGGGYNRYCTSDSCRYVPTPRQPTATPTKTCSKTGGVCNFQGDCCSGNVCWNGHCYFSSGPTQVPTTKPTGTNPTGTNPTGGPIIPTTKPPVGDKCPGAQACPNPSNKNLLQNCTPPDSDGTPKDTLCNEAGMIRPCGGKNYCCPSAGGAWTSDMTKCPAGNCTQCPGKPEAKLKGDADCSGITNINDASIWRSEFISSLLGKTVKNNWRADFDCDGKVTLNDISIWRDNFIKSL